MDLTNLTKASQFHGINRLADNTLRWFWFFAIFVLFLAAIGSLLVTIRRYEDNPTYLARSENYRSEMDFPSVILCPEINFPKYKMDLFLDEMRYPTDLNRTYMRKILRQLSAYYSPDVSYQKLDLENIERFLDYNNLNVEEVALRLTLSCNETLIRCRWRGAIIDCTKIFFMELAQFRYCCVFNGQSLRRQMKLQQHEKPLSPVITNSIGYTSGLMFVVNQSSKLSDINLTYKSITITGPQLFVESFLRNSTPLTPALEQWVGYLTEGSHISDESKSLDKDLRRCRLSTESLQYFPKYRTIYCKLECEMEEVNRRCRCLLLAHPMLEGAKLCQAKDLPCARLAAERSTIDSCGCLPACDIETDWLHLLHYKFPFKKATVIPFDEFYQDWNYQKITIFRIYVQRREVYLSTHESYFTWFNLFSQLGGTFGVFFGCSILSLIEIVQLLWYGFKKWYRKRVIVGHNVTVIQPQESKIVLYHRNI